MAPQTRSRTGTTKPMTTDEPEPVPKPKRTAGPRKRAQRAGPVAKTSATHNPESSAVSLFASLPFELFIEIANYLQPLEILLLARVNKLFRGLLMHRSALPVWRAVQRNVKELPPCPENLSEPRYAALLFLEECSTCSEPAPDIMDPVLQVRLCAKCREEQLVNPHHFNRQDLLFVQTALPGRHGKWCFPGDLLAVKAKLSALEAAGDQEELRRWTKDRRNLVKERDRISGPLCKWLRDREIEREQQLTRLKTARQAEIEARLKELDWEPADINQIEYKRKEQWRALVYTPEPLGDKDWAKLLPKLIELLKVNRTARLQLEADNRKGERRGKLGHWFDVLQRQSGPLVRAIRICEKTVDSPTIPSAEATNGGASSQCTKEYGRVQNCFPHIYHLLEWPEFKALAETDMPADEFDLKLQAEHHQLVQSIDSWRTKLELELVKLMPKDTEPIDSEAANFVLTAGPDDEQHSVDHLAIHTRKLLRADAFFTRAGSHDRTCYPEAFNYKIRDLSNLVYDTRMSSIAKAILCSLKHPDASHLEMMAMSRVYLCKRCPHSLQPLTWTEIVLHYLHEALHYETITASRRFRNAQNFTYVFVHDISPTNPNELLSPVTSKTELKDPHSDTSTYSCKLCLKGAGIFTDLRGGYRMEAHIRNVHLVDEPKVGTHYNMSRI